MSKGTLESIRTQSDKLHNRWMREFAGKPRHSRDLVQLDKLVEKAQALARKSKQIPGEKGDALEKVVKERLQLYTTERAAIAEVKYERPEVAEVHALGLAVDRVLAAWRRHFAGRDRRTRDLGLLDALNARLARSVARLGELAPTNADLVKPENLDGVRGQLEVMKDERSEIEKARRGLSDSDRVSVSLSDAATAMDRYRIMCAGQPRGSCSLVELDHILAVLRRVKQDVVAAGQAEAQAQNLTVIDQNLAAYEAERPRIAAAREETNPRERGGQLAAVANKLFEIYQKHFAGQARATRDLKLLSDICDRLADIADQMAEIDKAADEPLNRKNIPVVDERLKRYEAEWVEISKAKVQAAQGQAQSQARGAGQAGTITTQGAPGAGPKAPPAVPSLALKSGGGATKKTAPVEPQIRIEPKKT